MIEDKSSWRTERETDADLSVKLDSYEADKGWSVDRKKQGVGVVHVRFQGMCVIIAWRHKPDGDWLVSYLKSAFGGKR